jgi:hypothetical protein
MFLSVSTDFVLGTVVGIVIVLLFQQLTRATSGLGRWLPFLLIIGVVIGAILLLAQLGS